MIENIREQLTLIYDGDPWYGHSIRRTLESVDPEQVYDLPGNGMHSIAGLVAHMLTWREFAKQRLRGNTDYLPEQEQSFVWKRFSAKKACAWEAMMEQFNSNQQHLLTLLNQQDDTLLDRKVAGKSYTFHYLLNGLLQHDLYHLGQIVYINKLLNKAQTKPPERGMLRYDFRIFPFENLALQK